MPFSIIRDDITRVAADAIVNTADPEPVVGAGTDSAIHSAAGPRLLRARQRIGRIAVGSSVQTPAYDLPARYVLHTVSPAWIDGAHGERELLRRAYDAALNLAHRLGCLSVAFPLLSAKSLGFPQEIALSVAVGAVAATAAGHSEGYITSITDEIRKAIGMELDPDAACRRNVAYGTDRIRAAFSAHPAFADAVVCGAVYDIRTGAVEWL